MFCENCGKEIGDKNKFCPHCGAAVEPDQSARAQQQEEQPKQSARSEQHEEQPKQSAQSERKSEQPKQPVQSERQEEEQQIKSALKKKKTAAVIGVIVLAAVVIIGIIAAVKIFGGSDSKETAQDSTYKEVKEDAAEKESKPATEEKIKHGKETVGEAKKDSSGTSPFPSDAEAESNRPPNRN